MGSLGLVFLLAVAAAPRPLAPRPNVLLIVIDDIGNDYVNVYGEGPVADQPPTPQMDALAAEGLRFLNFCSYPSCSPTRVTTQTGRYGWRTQIGSNIHEDRPTFFRLSETLLPEILRPRGYRCALVGKWHMGSATSPFRDPILHGFEIFVGTKDNITDYFEFPKWTLSEEGGIEATVTNYATTEVTDDALLLMTGMPEPWFLTVAYHAAHTPLHVPPAALHSYVSPQTPIEMYGAMVEALDTELGRLLASVDRSNTAIFLFSDNGTDPAVSAAGLGRSKFTLYEGGINVPLIVAGAAVPVANHGLTTESLASTTDLYRTVLDLAGVKDTSRQQAMRLTSLPTTNDSVSFRPVLLQPSLEVRPIAYSEIFEPNGRGPYTRHRRMARSLRLKLIRDELTGIDEFYELQTAPPGLDGAPLILSDLTPVQQESFLKLSAYLD